MSSIPKIIHFIWVGDLEKPDLVKKCMESWRAFLPDYSIVEWNNESVSKINNAYVKEAYRNKKWAFVSDYLRLYALYTQGGVYLDTDVEITGDISKFLNLDFFSCYEIYNNKYFPISALMASKKGNKIIKDLLDDYENIHFETENGLDLTPNTVRISNYLTDRFGIKEPYDGTLKSILDDNSIIFPYWYFCTPRASKENFAIHHFNGSWKPAYNRKDKFFIFNKFIFSRFKKEKDGDYPLRNNEKVVCEFKLSNMKTYVILKIEND